MSIAVRLARSGRTNALDDMEPPGPEYLESSQANVYPDPEEIPIYPWLGASVSRPVLHSARPSVPSPMSCGGSSTDVEDANDGGRGGEGPLKLWRDANDPSVDPDFEFSAESNGSDDFMSGVGSDLPIAGPKTIGKRQRKSNEAPVRDGRGVSKRGRGAKKASLGRGAKGVKRGPRKPMEPNLEFKTLHSQATEAFVRNNYEEAEQLAQSAIAFNPEMFVAYSLLSEIHLVRGDREKALGTLFHGAHTRPGDSQVWLRVAQLILERETDDRKSALPDAIYCLSRVINLEQNNTDVRYQRASLHRELGYYGRAATEYEQLLKYLPHNTAILRELAKVYIDLDEIDAAVHLFDDSIKYHQSNEPALVTSFGWSDVNIYAELYGYLDQYELGIEKLKSLSRWLLGRNNEELWEAFNEDDREWDAEDQPRRIGVADFHPGAFPASTYGDGLPLELRVKLGIYRLRLGQSAEALNHFEWLDPEDYGPEAKLFDYTDLFREAADALRAAGLHNEALQYYEPLQEVRDYVDAAYFTDMALCYQEIGLRDEAEDCYETVIDNSVDSVDIRLQLQRLCKEHGSSGRSERLLAKLSLAANQRLRQLEETSATKEGDRLMEPTPSSGTMLASRPITSAKVSAFERGRRLREQKQRERDRESTMYCRYLHLQSSTDKARLGEEPAKTDWKSAAKFLTQDFRSNSVFYPPEKYMRFLGFTSEARARSAAAKPSQVNTGTNSDPDNALVNWASVPQEYGSISFDIWLDIFLEFALMLAQDGNLPFSYDILTGARDANVFYHSPDSLVQIHVCWFACALLQNDEVTLCEIARWFIKEYQFVTDGYRLFSALNRLCDGENGHFNCGPSQKFVLRQVKAVDYSLISEPTRRSIFQDKPGYSKDGSGNPIFATEMDVALLMLYGQILYAGRNFIFALNYLLRALDLDPENAMINLLIALSYIQHALKRQTDNRHGYLMQGFAFLSIYYDIRCDSGDPCERQEAEYNVARAHHLLGLTHAAIPRYQRCLDLGKGAHFDHRKEYTEDFAEEAAFALQSLWATSGANETARQVTRDWLVI